MRKITSAVLGLTFTLATAGLTLAAQAPASTPSGNTTSSTAPTAKKHVKHNKKSAKNATASPSTAATPAK
ncbi:MAG TPA: hypothetical protein VK789_06995 [Bryobacteraceae bacterium]|nr:hypothetical protein [Bryobacteraceae bacterium]